MEYSFNNLPEKVVVRGVFSQNCSLIMSKESEHGLRLGNLKLLIQKHGKKPVINNFQLKISSISGNIKIFVGNDNANVIFEEETSGAYDLRLWRSSTVIIGSRTTSNGVRIVCDNSEFKTGKDCMFSDGILIQTADQHGLVDLKTGEIFNNKKRKVILGDHVWLGRYCILTADINIGDGAIIGTGAIVTSDIHEKTVAAGVPAKVVRSDVTWSRSPVNLDIMSKNYVELSRIKKAPIK